MRILRGITRVVSEKIRLTAVQADQNIRKETMFMNKLKCSVTTCRHNENQLCDLSKIQVDGPAATESRDTCCVSYAERAKGANNMFSGMNSTASESTEIHCSAEHCAYNSNKKCNADNVKVAPCCADPCVVSETECTTFRPRA